MHCQTFLGLCIRHMTLTPSICVLLVLKCIGSSRFISIGFDKHPHELLLPKVTLGALVDFLLFVRFAQYHERFEYTSLAFDLGIAMKIHPS